MWRTKVLLADDHTLVLEAFKRLLEPEFEVVGAVADGRELLAAAQALNPDVILLDISMPLLNGLDAARQLKGLCPRTKLIFLTMNEDSDMAEEALRLGASGYLLKTSAPAEIAKAIHDAIRGLKYVTPTMKRELEKAFVEGHPNKKEGGEPTPRQREILRLLAEGRPMQEVASILKLAPRTVAYHKYRMMKQLRLKSNAELLRFAVMNGLAPKDKGLL